MLAAAAGVEDISARPLTFDSRGDSWVPQVGGDLMLKPTVCLTGGGVCGPQSYTQTVARNWPHPRKWVAKQWGFDNFSARTNSSSLCQLLVSIHRFLWFADVLEPR